MNDKPLTLPYGSDTQENRTSPDSSERAVAAAACTDERWQAKSLAVMSRILHDILEKEYPRNARRKKP